MNIADIEKYRYERKFVINSASSNVIELELKLHPALFSEIYEERIINNIYLDTLDFENYLDNLNGNSGRPINLHLNAFTTDHLNYYTPYTIGRLSEKYGLHLADYYQYKDHGMYLKFKKSDNLSLLSLNKVDLKEKFYIPIL